MKSRAELAEELSRRIHQAAEEGGRLARRAVEQGESVAEGLKGQAREATSRLEEALFTDLTVPVYLLPTGAEAESYHCHFDLAPAMISLQRGLLVRPRLQVWAHRADLDREQLGRRLSEAFRREAQEERRRRLDQETGEVNEAVARSTELQKSAAEGVKSSVAGVAGAAVAIALLSNPLFDLLFLLLAASAVVVGGESSLHYVRSTLDTLRYGREREQKVRRLEGEVRGRLGEMERALSRVDLHLHPRLHRLAQDLAALESAPPPPATDASSLSSPSVEEALASPRYREALPSWAHPLLH